MSRPIRVTPLSAALLVLLLVAVVFTFTGSKTLQIAGFAGMVVVLVLLASDRLRGRTDRPAHSPAPPEGSVMGAPVPPEGSAMGAPPRPRGPRGGTRVARARQRRR